MPQSQWVVHHNASYSPVVNKLAKVGFLEYPIEVSKDLDNKLNILNSKHDSLLYHLRFYIPEIYPHLEKVVHLDDDVIVQKDLTPLFFLDLHGNIKMEQLIPALKRFANCISTLISPTRYANVTGFYHYWDEQNADGNLWKLGTLPAGLLAFYGRTEPLDRKWHVLGLDFDDSIHNRLIESAAVVHFNGNMKPWLMIGIGRAREVTISCTIRQKPLALPWGRTPRLDFGVKSPQSSMILPADHVLRAVINARLPVPLLLLVCFWSYLFHVVMLPYQVGDVPLTWSAAVLLSSG
ncbi:probable galacturonosyltransferase 11 [Tanacetum coccineum]